MEVIADANIKEYYKKIEVDVRNAFSIAKEARKKGFDFCEDVETRSVSDLAERAETITGPKGVAKRYRQIVDGLSGENKRIKAIFKIFEEIVLNKICNIPNEENRIEQAIKTALVLQTEGVVVAPIDGITKIKISKNPDGTNYIDIYYAGPIRAAGGTAQVLPLILGDYARKLLGLDRYKPTKDEVERYVEEIQIYDEIVSRQYKMSDDEIRKIINGCPVCINGEPTEEREVSVHRDLPRIPHNRVRGGACLVISEGVALKARKALKFASMLNLDWNWLEGIIKHEKSEQSILEIEPSYKYLEGVAVGRPIFSYPGEIGGFRLRYGRSRASGIMCKAVHPATMVLLDDFLAIGTQIKIERPGKSAVITSCDSIEGPIVKLNDESVVKVDSFEQAKAIKDKLDKILFLGDILIAYGDFKYSAHPLLPAGYNEDWWALELEEAIKANNLASEEHKIALKALNDPKKVSFNDAIELSKRYNIPLHPRFTYYYGALNTEEIKALVRAVRRNYSNNEKELMIEYERSIKEILEKIGLPHKCQESKIVISEPDSEVLISLFGKVEIDKAAMNVGEDVNKFISRLCGIRIRDKCGTFLGARMGRPEASGERLMKGSPHTLFPIGEYGGNTRSINKAAMESEKRIGIDIEIITMQCPKCNQIMPKYFCNKCKCRTISVNFCPSCKIKVQDKVCDKCGNYTKPYAVRKERLDLLLKEAANELDLKIPNPFKGVHGLISTDKVFEPLEKGLLRAKYNLHTFRDGTIRYDLINIPITHFKPKEINTSIKKLKELGYKNDLFGCNIISEEQILEIMPQDIIIHNKAGDFLVKVANFVDDELNRFYGMKPFYNVKTKEDLVGHYVLALAPHTSAAIVGRIIGFTKTRGCLAHPYFHQTKRRNADGDQDSLLLLMDVLLNFSQEYLSSSRGGRMDAPLVFTTILKPDEIDTEVYCMDIVDKYPLELYEKSLNFAMPEAVKFECVEDRLNTEKQYSGFLYTHESSDICLGPEYSTYVMLKTMEEKVFRQAQLQRKIKAVNLKDSLARVIETHLLPDIIGNTRSFCRQQFRCTNCNSKYRRIPLSGKCLKCGKEGLTLTIAQGSVEKYLEVTKKIIKDYSLGEYLEQRVLQIEDEIGSLFKTQTKSQRMLADFLQ
ncbi:MAG: DNA polymerase II large subunit [Candidatus Diapherotrites archaeon]|nr:DNA polymerase II large subunit [Candidatus Diapherotrites archaeon]